MAWEIVRDGRRSHQVFYFKNALYLCGVYSTIKDQFHHTSSPGELIAPHDEGGAESIKLHSSKTKLRPRIMKSVA